MPVLSAYESYTKPWGGGGSLWGGKGQPSLQHTARRRGRMRELGLIGPEPPTPMEQGAVQQARDLQAQRVAQVQEGQAEDREEGERDEQERDLYTGWKEAGATDAQARSAARMGKQAPIKKAEKPEKPKKGPWYGGAGEPRALPTKAAPAATRGLPAPPEGPPMTVTSMAEQFGVLPEDVARAGAGRTPEQTREYFATRGELTDSEEEALLQERADLMMAVLRNPEANEQNMRYAIGKLGEMGVDVPQEALPTRVQDVLWPAKEGPTTEQRVSGFMARYPEMTEEDATRYADLGMKPALPGKKEKTIEEREEEAFRLERAKLRALDVQGQAPLPSRATATPQTPEGPPTGYATTKQGKSNIEAVQKLARAGDKNAQQVLTERNLTW